MPDNTLLTAKLHHPPLRVGIIPRQRLVDHLHEGLSFKLTLLSTPAGFGKTTLLCEWIKTKNLKAAWVSLDEADNDHGRFISYVMAALRTLDFGADDQIQAIAQAAEQGIPLESPMTILMNEFAALPPDAPIVLILDDYHVIQNPAIHESMMFALEYMPENVHIVLATRSDPPLALSRFRARGWLNELRPQDLRFNHEEISAFLQHSIKVRFSAEQVSALEDRTEGWAAGLQLAALAMQDRSDIDQFMRDFVGSHRYILDYLTDEVFTRQPQDAQDFLLKTSILDRMCAGLCDAITETENGAAMLQKIQRENVFVVPLDQQGQWVRYHHLFADLLKNRADQIFGKEIAALHRRAALWFDAHHQPYDAIDHALRAQDYDLAIDLMTKATPALAMRSEIGVMLKWLNALPNELKIANPRIPLMFAWAHFFMTNIESVNPHLRDALSALGIDPRTDDPWRADLSVSQIEMLAQIAALQTFVAVNCGAPEQGIRIARKALTHLPEREKISKLAVLAALGDAYRDSDNFAAASQVYSEALAVAEAIDQPAASLTMRMDLARLRVKMGQLRHAESICREALAWSGESYHPLFPVVQAHTLLGDILRERNELDAAEQILFAGIRQCKWAGYQRYLVFCQVSVARIKFAKGDLESAAQSLDAAEQTAAFSGSKPLRDWVIQFRARLIKSTLSNWADQNQLSLNDDGAFRSEDAYLTLARYHIDQSRRSRSREANLKAVIAQLERLLVSAQRSARIGSAIEIMMLQALALNALGQTQDALPKFSQSLALAEPEGYARLFVDEGEPAAEMLILAVQHNIHPEYAARLLGLIHYARTADAQTNMTDALTDRESEVLRLLAAGLSNQAIAEKLVVSLSTIKTHVTRIYSKLDVTSRTQAIVRAREMKII